MLDRAVKFPDGWLPGTPGVRPLGIAKNATTIEAEDGAPWDKDYINDIEGVFQGAVLRRNVTISGVPDTGSVSDVLDAFGLMFGLTHATISDAVADATLKKDMLITIVDNNSTARGGGANYLVKTTAQASTDGDVVPSEFNFDSAIPGLVLILQSVSSAESDLALSYTFKTVALMQASLIVFPVGKKIFWQGYYDQSDGGSNWGIVTSGTHTDDGGSIFTLADGKYVKANIQSKINIRKFGAKIDGVTVDDQSWINTHAALPTNGGKIRCPVGSGYSRIETHLTFDKSLTIEGESNSTANTSEKSGSGVITFSSGELTLSGPSSGVRDFVVAGGAGNTGNGINFIGPRPWGQNISAHEQGQDGIVIGSDIVAANVNSFNFIRLKSKTNGRHGVFVVSKIGESKDANAGTISGLDSAGNQGNGLQLQNASNNTFIGIHCETNNGPASDAVNCVDSDGNMFLQPYCENSTLQQFRFDVNCTENKVLGMRNGTSTASVTDLGTDNIILGQERAKGIFNFFDTKILFRETGVSAPGISGWWEFLQNGTTRALEFLFKGTTTSPIIFQLSHDTSGVIEFITDWLKVGGGTTLKRNISQARTLDFPSIPAHTTAEIDFTLAGSVVGDLVTFSPLTSIESGLVWSGYVVGANTLRLRLANVTTGAIDPASKSWRAEVRGY